MKKYERKFVDLPNGERYAYIEAGEGDRKLLMIHGNMASCIHWTPLIEKLEDAYHIIAIDMRGYGETSYNHPFTSLHELADDLALFCRTIDFTDFDIAGWSTGGGVAMSFVARYPEYAKKLYLVNSISVKGCAVYRKTAKGAPIMGSIFASRTEMLEDIVTVKNSREFIASKNFEGLNNMWKYGIYTKEYFPSEEDNKVYIEESFKQRCSDDAYWALSTFNVSCENSFYAPGNCLAEKINIPIQCIYGTKDKIIVKYMTDEIIDTFKHLKKDFSVYAMEGGGHSSLVGPFLPQLVQIFLE